MSSEHSNSKKTENIAKNTLMLFFRMAITMFISLYTSRILLAALGVDDFGISNVVGGIIGFFGFIIYSMQTAIQRFLTVAMGKGDIKEVQHVFSIGIFIHAAFSLAVLLGGETVGLWFLENKLVIPEERLEAAFWIYQFCIAGTIISLMSIPFTAEVIAHEKMSAFAYLSILNTGLNFLIAFSLQYSPADKLITFGFLGLCTNILNITLYIIYCKRRFEECVLTVKVPKKLLKEMVSFAGWDFFGVLAYCVSTQGATLMLNMFFGPSVNAARAIAQTVLEKTKSFSNNFTTALNPAISKSYGANEHEYMNKLLFSGSKLVFILVATISLPLFIETPYLLKLWLTVVPEYTVTFIQILLIQSVFLTMWNPLFTAGLATGKIKQFGLKTSICNILKMPVCYLLLLQGFSPVVFIAAYTILEFFSYGIQLFTLRGLINFNLKEYMVNVQLKSILIFLSAFPIPFLLSQYLDASIVRILLVGVVSCVFSIGLSYFVLLNREEKAFIWKKTNIIFDKIKRK